MRNWFLIFVLTALLLVILFLNFNFPKKIYIKGDNYAISKFIDYLNKNGINFKLVEIDEAKYIIDFDKLEINLYNGLSFRLYWNNDDILRSLKSLNINKECKILKGADNFYLYNIHFYKHFTFNLSCGINIIVSPVPIESLEYFAYQTFIEIVKGDYSKFENGYLVTNMYIYFYKEVPELIGIYDPVLEVLNPATKEKTQ